MDSSGLHKRIMAIDLGDARTGLAVSDPLGMICGEAWTVEEWNMERLSLKIAAEAAERNVGLLVLGLPKNMDGTEGPRAEHSREFRNLLMKQTDIPVAFWDERRSSIEAHQICTLTGKKRKNTGRRLMRLQPG